ncbi:MAG: hypothetical protein R3C10_18460 [Pirellulales bacterium]
MFATRVAANAPRRFRVLLVHTWLFFAGAVVLAAGCDDQRDPHGRLALSGTVTFQGQPLDQGLIDFLPVDRPGSAGARGRVRDGTYSIPRHQGVVPGRYRVVITSAESVSAEAPDGTPGRAFPLPGKERIPPEFNSESEWTVEAREGDENTFEFTIP